MPSWKIVLTAAVLASARITGQDLFEIELHRRLDAAVVQALATRRSIFAIILMTLRARRRREAQRAGRLAQGSQVLHMLSLAHETNWMLFAYDPYRDVSGHPFRLSELAMDGGHCGNHALLLAGLLRSIGIVAATQYVRGGAMGADSLLSRARRRFTASSRISVTLWPRRPSPEEGSPRVSSRGAPVGIVLH